MDIKNEYIDFLTNIPNERYVVDEYHSYIKSHENSKFIMIDFKKFKLINDNFGHEVGDICLKTFAKILESTFDDSIVSRLHGDEYCIITNLSDQDIEKRFKLVNSKIAHSDVTKTLGRAFEFNAGITSAEKSIKHSREKADYIMYHAKKNGKNYEFFSEEIWAEKLNEDKMIEDIKSGLENGDLTYYGRRFHDSSLAETDILEVTSRSKDGSSIITSENYDLLNSKSLIKQLDFYNLDMVLNKLTSKSNGKILFNFDCKSLLAKPGIVEYFSLTIDAYNINPSNLIISINMNDVSPKQYDSIISLITEFKKLGLNICIDKITDFTPDAFIIDVNPHFLKYDPKYIQSALVNPISRDLLALKIGYLASSGMKPLFTCVRNQGDFVRIKELTKNVPSESEVLLSGDFVEKESRIM